MRYVWLPRISERYEVRLNFEIETRFLMTAEEPEATAWVAWVPIAKWSSDRHVNFACDCQKLLGPKRSN